MALFKQKQPRGAVTRQAKKPSKPLMRWQRLVPVVWSATAMAVVYAFYLGAGALLNQPVEKVTVAGELRHVEKSRVISEVTPFLQQGFISLDMAAIRQQLTNLPWVYQVRLERVWPNNITINIVEQQAIAQWGEEGYLNHRGEMFNPKKKVAVNDLPVLKGPEYSTKTVMSHYRSIGELLKEQGLYLKSLIMSERGSWQALLSNGVQIELGRDQVVEKVKRFVFVYQQALPKGLVAVKKVDMRYSNGVAVSWQRS